MNRQTQEQEKGTKKEKSSINLQALKDGDEGDQMTKKKMKVFVWENVLVDYTGGMMVAIAPTVKKARAILLRKCNYIPEDDLNLSPKEFDLSESAAFICWGGG